MPIGSSITKDLGIRHAAMETLEGALPIVGSKDVESRIAAAVISGIFKEEHWEVLAVVDLEEARVSTIHEVALRIIDLRPEFNRPLGPEEIGRKIDQSTRLSGCNGKTTALLPVDKSASDNTTLRTDHRFLNCSNAIKGRIVDKAIIKRARSTARHQSHRTQQNRTYQQTKHTILH